MTHGSRVFDQGLGVMVFNITFNNISAVLWWPFYWWWKSEYPEKTTDLPEKKSVKSRMRETFIYLFIYLYVYLSVVIITYTVYDLKKGTNNIYFEISFAE